MRNTVLTSLIFAAVASRLLPHWPSFTAVGATALFAGAAFKTRWAAMMVPLIAMVISDFLLGLCVYGIDRCFTLTTIVIYVCLALTALMGRGLGRSALGVAAGSTASVALFFLATNFMVWCRGGLYSEDFAGLMACYTAAIPYSLNMFAGNLVFGASLFGLLAWAERRYPKQLAVA